MKLNEITIPFVSQSLYEIAMNQKTFQQILSQYGDDIYVGFEYEFTVPENSRLFPDTTDSVPSKPVSEMDPSDFFQLFEPRYGRDRDTERRFERMYEEEISERADDYANEHWEDFIEDDQDAEDSDDEEEAREKAREYYIEHEAPDHEDFFDEKGAGELIDELNLEPVYGYADDREQEVYIEEPEPFDEDSMDQLIGQVEADVEDEITVDHVTSDGSVTSPGVEVVTAPININEAIDELYDMFNWMRASDVQVDDTAGLHINISVENEQKLDPLKLAVFLGEQYSLNMFGRLKNSYTPSQIRKLLEAIKREYNPFDQQSITKIMNMLDQSLEKHKYGSFNLNKLDDGYLEFRIVGGEDYHKKAQEVENMIYRFATAMVIASDPKARKEEYFKKVAKLLQQGTEGQAPTDKYKSQLPKRLLQIDLQYQKSANNAEGRLHLDEALTRYYNADQRDRAVRAFDMLLYVSRAVQATNMALDVQSIKFLRPFYTNHQQDIEQNRKPENVQTIQQLLRIKPKQQTQPQQPEQPQA